MESTRKHVNPNPSPKPTMWISTYILTVIFST